MYSGNPDFPRVGDVRIRFEVVLLEEVSVIAEQHETRLVVSHDVPENTIMVVSGDTPLESMLYDNS